MKTKFKSLLTVLLLSSLLGGCFSQTNPSPYINDDGYWVVNGEVTDVLATGEKGDKGDKGDPGKDGRSILDIQKTSSNEYVDVYTITYSDGSTSTFIVTNGEDGEQGIQGVPGNDGHSPEVSIGNNGNWFINGVDSGVKAQGPKGEQGDPGNNGENGNDGKTPYIGSNGNWWIGNKDTGVKAEGSESNDSNENDIESIYLENQYIPVISEEMKKPDILININFKNGMSYAINLEDSMIEIGNINYYEIGTYYILISISGVKKVGMVTVYDPLNPPVTYCSADNSRLIRLDNILSPVNVRITYANNSYETVSLTEEMLTFIGEDDSGVKEYKLSFNNTLYHSIYVLDYTTEEFTSLYGSYINGEIINNYRKFFNVNSDITINKYIIKSYYYINNYQYSLNLDISNEVNSILKNYDTSQPKICFLNSLIYKNIEINFYNLGLEIADLNDNKWKSEINYNTITNAVFINTPLNNLSIRITNTEEYYDYSIPLTQDMLIEPLDLSTTGIKKIKIDFDNYILEFEIFVYDNETILKDIKICYDNKFESIKDANIEFIYKTNTSIAEILYDLTKQKYLFIRFYFYEYVTYYSSPNSSDTSRNHAFNISLENIDYSNLNTLEPGKYQININYDYTFYPRFNLSNPIIVKGSIPINIVIS